MPLHDEEVFAPVAPISVVDTVEEAVEIVNGTRFGLSTAVFGRDLDNAWAVADRIRSGTVHVNDGSAMHESQVPFGVASSAGRRPGRSRQHRPAQRTTLGTCSATPLGHGEWRRRR
jgi:benzaldehyde dehydrogenase (NAD)